MERIEKLIDAIKNENPVDAEELFKAEIGDRIKNAVAQRKVEVAKRVFSPEPEQSQIDKIINPGE
tara:strand:+ start:6113 stop:6307 length:195 start_codon:yes stop_codon:yes gene_type:complete